MKLRFAGGRSAAVAVERIKQVVRVVILVRRTLAAEAQRGVAVLDDGLAVAVAAVLRCRRAVARIRIDQRRAAGHALRALEGEGMRGGAERGNRGGNGESADGGT